MNGHRIRKRAKHDESWLRDRRCPVGPSSQDAMKEGRNRSCNPADMSIFNPDRWIVNGENGDEFSLSAGPQLVFGLGTRGVMAGGGKRLAYLEMRIFSTTLVVWNFELLKCPAVLSGYQSSLITTNKPK
jgi:hypothetical protein